MSLFNFTETSLTGKTLLVDILDYGNESLLESGISVTESGTGVFSGSSTISLNSPLYKLVVKESGTIVSTRVLRTSFAPPDGVSPFQSSGGYEFTGGFEDRTTGLAGQSDEGSNVLYTQALADSNAWLRFGFSESAQQTNDAPYWTDPAPSSALGVGLFGGDYMPAGVSRLFDFGFTASNYSDAVTTGSLQYTQADGSLDFTQCVPGDLALCRFDFNVLPQIANTTVEVALIWQTRDSNDNPTFTFALTGDPQFYGTGSVGRTFLARPILSAYFASNEDVNARALFAIRADNPVQIQPLTTLITIQR